MARAFPASSGEVLLAGGAVRDLLLGRAPRDLDLLAAAAGPPEEATALRALAGVSGMEPVLFDRKPPPTRRVVVEGIVVDLQFMEPGGAAAALARRDFTLNALAVPLAAAAGLMAGSPPSDAVSRVLRERAVDPLGGITDLGARVIRAASPEALDEDPLRILRAVRLAATLQGFHLHPELTAAIRARAGRVREAAAERIRAELDLVLESGRGGSALRLMDDLGILEPVLPELGPLRGLRQPRSHHDHDAFEHTLRTVEESGRLAGGSPEAGLPPLPGEDAGVLGWAALLHDAGKAATATVDADGTPHFYGHESASARLAERALGRLRASRRLVERAVRLVELHLRLGTMAGEGRAERGLRRAVRAAGDLTPLMVLLALADRRAAGGEDAAAREAALVATCRRALALRAEEAAAAREPPLLDGREVMEILAIPPGPRVGTVLRWLADLRAEGRVRTREEAADLLRSLPPPRLED
jgi:tRNA nucleotidyltransferase/poly(A) polymerase